MDSTLDRTYRPLRFDLHTPWGTYVAGTSIQILSSSGTGYVVSVDHPEVLGVRGHTQWVPRQVFDEPLSLGRGLQVRVPRYLLGMLLFQASPDAARIAELTIGASAADTLVRRYIDSRRRHNPPLRRTA